MFEKFFYNIVVFLLKLLNKCEKKLKNKCNEIKSNYQFLTPNDNAENIEEYSNALTEALDNKKVRNIAISGSYGSGKSSFIKTFEKNNKYNGYEFLDISLARFNKDETDGANIDLSLIEKSILEQMFYKVKSKTIPQSRLNKINRLRGLFFKVVSIFVVFLSFIILFKSEWLEQKVLFKEILKLFQSEHYYINYIPSIILIVGFYFLLQKFLFLLSNTSIDKINLKDLEIVSNDKKNESLLNKHLDEILYFFEKTKFNVIVFQDLDRFKNLDIFTKLRELNNFINNSDQIDRNVKFIYAVKDEIFCDSHERTKFFDFVIPIIPYINVTNSKEKLLELFGSEIKQKFLYDISLYISDMRLLKNIYNEYRVYSLNLDNQLNKTELLAMIIYKNFEPQDFEKLHKHQGLVFNIFNKKDEYIQGTKDKLNEKIDSIKKEITNIENEPQKNIEELRKIYLLKIVEKFGRQFNGNIYLESNSFNLTTALENENFELIKNSKEISCDDYYARSKLDFRTIQDNVNSEFSYKEREQFILDKKNNKINQLLKEIEIKKEEIQEIENYTISKIINSFKDVKVFDENFEKKKLLKYLISYGHINKDYHIYMSNFFGVSISKNDHDFLINIKNNGKHFDFNYELNNIEEILEKERIEAGEFKKESILNFKLMNKIINEQSAYPRHFIQLFKQLSNESEVSIEFIFQYINTQTNLMKFINGLVRYFPSIWKHIVSNSEFSEENKEKYFYILLDNLEVENILKLNVDNTLKSYIELQTEFYHIPNEDFCKKLESVIKSLKIKFKFFKENKKKITPFKFIYENNYYELNEKMINYIIYVYNDFNSSIYLNQAHYSLILNSNTNYLKEYVHNNMNYYIENIFLKIKKNVNESEETMILLLKNQDIDDSLKEKIIQKENTKILKLNSIENKDFWEILFIENKIISSWDNVFEYYKYKETLDKSLIKYLNIEENSAELLNVRIDNKYKENHENFNGQLLRDLIECNDFSLESYKNLVLKNGYHYEDLNLSNLDENKINILANDYILKFGNINFELLKENSKNQHIIFIEKNIDGFIREYSNFSVDSDDIIKLLESKDISEKNKRDIIELIHYSFINSPRISKLIYKYIDKKTIRDYNYTYNMVSNLETIETKVNLIVEQESDLTNEQLIELIDLLPKEYRKISGFDGTQTLISNKYYNNKFIEILTSREFITSHKLEKKSNEIRLFIKNR
ncbi:MAG: hypothetical protein ACNI3H_14820 [Halarcobacter ebronensis]|uniref:YobI family P-loop NTPase n=1 Tax=Halarcobacter ebronensis TaxID=1462615 RepID=UPI003C72225B